ncbi:MAG TPA: hypothetical protein VGB55_11020 [Tepidisphaeraceae bacterium]|jgi:hypothetical protein
MISVRASCPSFARSILSAAAVTTVVLLAGCARQTYSNQAQVNTEPLNIDPAMEIRDWEPSTAYYANGDVYSWSTGFGYRSQADSGWKYLFADPGTYVVNLVTMPWTFYQERNGVVSQGDTIPPSHTAVPPVPPTEETLPPAEEAMPPSPATQPGE